MVAPTLLFKNTRSGILSGKISRRGGSVRREAAEARGRLPPSELDRKARYRLPELHSVGTPSPVLFYLRISRPFEPICALT
ncbi:hypothetical protein CH380_10070 [Leptospira adleri]|uniref:Uncharacterized protein n=1 Tax=Leptospira adleri TaxID=2023186 RepID=A0A2M9YPP7_9LEPT|nr:hypothetical protein CH380_10070 [Leptospira adleri]PJZ62231.1 hypothetical protein CH376_09160 [Leptospira adleri]